MKKIFLGKDAATTITGYVLAGLVALDEIVKSGETHYGRIAIAVGIAVVGRVVNTCKKQPKKKVHHVKKPL